MMKKCSLLLLLCLAILNPLQAFAANPLDTEAAASLTLHYQKDGSTFPDLQIKIYRVAEAFKDGTFELISPFSSYPVNIHDITMQEQWKYIATTLSAYIIANQVAPDEMKQTNEEGIAHFSDLSTGLYLVSEVVGENTSGTYLFSAFMVYLPMPQEDGSYLYNVNANPKCSAFVPKDQYTVTKLWQDNGANRPKEVVVDIYKDGVLKETQVLNAENNWSYTWYVTGEDQSKWTVAERAIPDSYKVSIQQTGSVFSIINTRQTEPTPPPQTGDTSTPLLWILVMCISGVLLILIGFYGRRRK